MIGKWKKIRTIQKYNFKHYQVNRDEVLSPGNIKTEYTVVRKNPSVIIIPIDHKGNVYFTKQHRYPKDKYTIELPAGGIEQGQNLKSAKNELAEEMDLVSSNWKKLGILDIATGMSDSVFYIYLARDVRKRECSNPVLLDKDLHKTIKISGIKLNGYIRSGRITEASTLSALFIAQQQEYLLLN